MCQDSPIIAQFERALPPQATAQASLGWLVAWATNAKKWVLGSGTDFVSCGQTEGSGLAPGATFAIDYTTEIRVKKGDRWVKRIVNKKQIFEVTATTGLESSTKDQQTGRDAFAVTFKIKTESSTPGVIEVAAGYDPDLFGTFSFQADASGKVFLVVTFNTVFNYVRGCVSRTLPPGHSCCALPAYC